jgi:two-component system, LytTR family, response regulator
MTSAPLRTLVVDDEPIARRVLCEELDELPGIVIVGEAGSGEQAVECIAELTPHLVLLDLQMPGMDGFGVVSKLEGPNLPSVVIVTAFDQHAIRAFETGAIDYLLKPVGQERLARCLDRVRQLRGSAGAVAESLARLQEMAAARTASRPRKIVGRAGAEYHLLDASQVMAFQAEREIVWIITRKQRYLATQPLRTIQEKLDGMHFARVHRNALVNLEHIVKMAPLSSQRWLLTLANQQEFIVSKRQARAVQELLSW